MTCGRVHVFLMNFEVLGNVMKYCLECLIDLALSMFVVPGQFRDMSTL